MKNDEIILQNISKMIDCAKEIASLDEGLGNIFLVNIANSMNIASLSQCDTKEIDVSEKVKIVSELVGLDIDEYVKTLMSTNNNLENSENESIDFIINNSDIDDYEKFIRENSSNQIKNLLNEINGEL